MKRNSKKSFVTNSIQKCKALFVGEKKELRILGIIFGGGMVMIGGLFFSSSQSTFLKTDVPVTTVVGETPCAWRSQLTGACVTAADKQNPAVVGIMIENHPVSRPQAGLAEAAVVYEALVEGNYTRFLALYPRERVVAAVGPVRSSRPYYLDWLAEYANPVYLHVGGSPDALQRIAERSVRSVNEMGQGQYFWRSDKRSAPHNVYTKTDLWQKLPALQATENLTGWSFTTSTITPCAQACVDFIEIPYLRPDFVTGWKFNSSTARYERWQDGRPHHTETGSIYADTVVIQESPVTVLDDVGRLEMKTLGSGPAIVVMNGQKILGTWQKNTATTRTLFYDQSGQLIMFKPGTVWVQVVPRLTAVHITVL